MSDDPLTTLIGVTDLEQIELNIFRGHSPATETLTRVFGGQVASQALVAASRTVDPARSVHSIHAYFLRPGDPKIPIIYEVDRIRDGRSFATRRVVAIQRGQAIFNLAASYQDPEDGYEHQDPMPAGLPEPETLPRLNDVVTHWRAGDGPPRPFELMDVRPVDPWPSSKTVGETTNVWMRTTGPISDDPLLHICILTYASDLMLLNVTLGPHGAEPGTVAMASLDHAMWFHRPFRVDEWMLYEQRSPSATNGRGLAMARFFTREGKLAVSVVQEGLIRPPRSQP